VNEKSQVTHERLYFEERKSIRNDKEIAGRQKNTEKPRQQRKAANSSKTPQLPRRDRKLKMPSYNKIDSFANRPAILAPR
jgi:hypothetical protein